MLRRLYDWTMGLAGRRHALWALAAVSFAESSVFPVPPDVLLIPMVLARREQAWRIAAVCTLSSVLGGLLGYAIGYFFFEGFGRDLLGFYGHLDKFESFQSYYNAWGAWIVAGAGVTPFPFKVITVASGVTALDPAVFIAAATLARGLRFFLVSGLLWYFGEPMRNFIERHLGALAAAAVILLVGGFLLVRFVL